MALCVFDESIMGKMGNIMDLESSFITRENLCGRY